MFFVCIEFLIKVIYCFKEILESVGCKVDSQCLSGPLLRWL